MAMIYENVSMNAFVSQRNFQLLPSFCFVTVLLVTESGHTVDSNDSNVKSGLFISDYVWKRNFINANVKYNMNKKRNYLFISHSPFCACLADQNCYN